MQGNPAQFAPLPVGPGVPMGPGFPPAVPVPYAAPAMPTGKAVPYLVPVASGAAPAPLVNVVPVAGGVIPLPAYFGQIGPWGKAPVGPFCFAGLAPAYPTWVAPVAPSAPYLAPAGTFAVGPYGPAWMDP